MRLPRLLPVLLAGLAACSGGVIEDGGSTGDGPRKLDHSRVDLPKTVDQPHAGADLPITPGEACLYGACGPNLICMANQCLKMCIQPMSGCNDKVTECGTNHACMFASSFTDACYPATAQAGQPCDLSKALYCVGGALCVKVGTNTPKCLKLCKYGCGSAPCQKTSNGCEVCIE